MIVIAELYVRFPEKLSGVVLERDAEAILNYADDLVKSHYSERYKGHAFQVHVRIERGSTRVWVTVTSLLGVLIYYGDVRQSIDYLVKDAPYIGTTILPEVASKLHINQIPDDFQRRRGIPGKLLRLFQKVEIGELSAEEATHRAVDILFREVGPEAVYEAPGLTEQLGSAFRQAVGHVPTFPSTAIPPERPDRPELPPPTLPPERRIGVMLTRDEKGKLRVRSY